MYTNVWYSAAFSRDVTDTPQHARMLGRDFVLFRDANGQARCLSNVCCHRGAPLHKGQLHEDGTLACCQHGWRYGGNGHCVFIPAAADGAAIPRAARVDSYLVEERYGILWVLLGDDPKQAAPIFDMPEFEAEEWRLVTWEEVWDANYHWTKFANLDYVHLPIVHKTLWNGGIRPPSHEVEYLDSYSLGSKITVKTPGARGDWGKLRDAAETTVTSRLKFFLSGLTIKVDVEIGGTGTGTRFIAYDMSTPIDETTTQMRFMFFRNFMLDPQKDNDHLKRNFKNIGEDRAIAEAQLPRILPPVPARNTILVDPEDKMVREYWAILGKLRDRGWQIDHKTLRETEDSGGYHVIPSPVRKADPEGWVYDTVPLLHPDSHT